MVYQYKYFFSCTILFYISKFPLFLYEISPRKRYLLQMKKLYRILGISLLWVNLAQAQGDDLLLQQYRTGPDLDAFYHNWNFEIQANFYRMRPDASYTKRRVSLGGGIGVERRLSKTFGLALSPQWQTVHYRYDLPNNTSKDRLQYLLLPFTGRAHLTRRLFLEAGPSLAIPLRATNEDSIRSLPPTDHYNKGVFKVNPGMLLAVSYNPWWRLHVKVMYQLWRRKANPLQYQPNRFRGFSLQLHYFLKNPRKKPTP